MSSNVNWFVALLVVQFNITLIEQLYRVFENC
jgi:hypothetical protein